MHGSMRRVRQKFAETGMNQHFSKTLTTQDSHIYQTPISFTYTSNHHKLHIYIKPPQAFTYTSNHLKLSHIPQTTTSFTYILHIYIKLKIHIYMKPQANKGNYG